MRERLAKRKEMAEWEKERKSFFESRKVKLKEVVEGERERRII